MLNLGTLEFVLGINTRGLDEAYQRVNAFGQKVAQVQNLANRGSETQIGAYRRIENAILSAGEKLNSFLNKIENAKVSPEVRTNLIQQAEEAFADLTKRATEFKKVSDSTNLDRAAAKFKNDLGEADRTLSSIVRAERDIAAEQRNIAQAAERADRAFARQATALASASERARNLASAIDLADLGSNNVGTKIGLQDRLQTAVNAFRGQLEGSTPLNPREFANASNIYKREIGEIGRELRRLKSEAIGPAIENFNEFKRRLQSAGSTMLLINGHLGGMSTRLLALSTIVGQQGIKWGIFAGAMTAVGVATTALVRGALTSAMKIEKVEKALTAVSGSAAVAQAQLKFLRETADLAGAEFTGLAASYSRFFAASRSAGQTVDTTQQQFRDVSLAAGMLSLTVEDTQGVFRAFEQILSKGTVQAEELRGQLGDRLPGAFAIAADAMKVTERELNKMMKAGDVISKEFVPKFIEAMKLAYNIDGTAIDTLQAGINRATNSVTLFFAAFASNTRILDVAKKVLEVFADVVDYLTENMDQLIDTSAKVAGAIAGMTAAWVAFKVVTIGSALMTSLVAGLTAALTAIRAARTATLGWAAAIKALDIAWATSAVGRLVTIILRLTLAVGGAVAGYVLMDKWLKSADAAMDSSGETVEQYIAQQKRMGQQVRSVTQDLIKQRAALLADATANLQNETAELRRRHAAGRTVVIPGLLEFHSDVSGQRKVVQQQLETVKRLREQLKGLQEVATLPEMGAGGGFEGGSEDGEDAGDKAQETIDAVDEIIRAYQRAEEQMEAMVKGPQALADLEALYAAQDAIQGFTDNQLAMADAALRKIGLTTGTVEERLASLVGTTNNATDALEAFKDVWQAIEEAQQGAKDTLEQVQLMMAGGDDTDLRQLENFQKAMDAIKDLSPEGVQQLLAMIQDMTGVIIVSTDPVAALAQAIADLWDTTDQGKEKIQILQNFGDAVADMAETVAENQARIAGINMGLSDEDLDRWVRGRMLVQHWESELRKSGMSAAEVAVKIAELQGALKSLDTSEVLLEQAERWGEWRDSASKAIAETVGELAKGFDNIGDLAENLINRLLDAFIELYVVEPLMKELQTIMGGTPSGMPGGSGGSSTGQGIAGFLNAAASIFTSLFAFSNGGLVNGSGTNSSDSNLARLSDDEFVMDASATRRWGANNLEALNHGVNPWASGSNASSAPIEITVKVDGARGNAEVRTMAYQGAQMALKEYDKKVGGRVVENQERYG